MPLHIRPIAVNVAVICFFSLSSICLVNGLSPITCCKRALAGAVVAYIAATLAVKIVNAVLMSAMIKSRTNRQKEKGNGG